MHPVQHTWTKLSVAMRIWIITKLSSRERARPCAALTSSKVTTTDLTVAAFSCSQLRLVIIFTFISLPVPSIDDEDEDEEDEDGEAGAEEGEGAQTVLGGSAVSAASVQPSAPQQVNSPPSTAMSSAST